MLVQPYLFFEGRCEEAAEFYKRVLNAQVEMLMRFKEAPPQQSAAPEGCAPGPIDGEKVMHMSLRIGETTVMMSDGRCGGQPSFQGFSLSVTVPDAAAVDRVFNALAEGGQVLMPAGETFFAERFGMCADRFGVSWMVIAVKAP
ncbi:VOC family protein [Cupriavidus basilensis]|uniref:VOC family protein n=1 Tax=Cupriavidus basilensis TaxID=68895 RepID=UPI000751509D|nr:VOC family protein [Cupriavidus basilensis]